MPSAWSRMTLDGWVGHAEWLTRGIPCATWRTTIPSFCRKVLPSFDRASRAELAYSIRPLLRIPPHHAAEFVPSEPKNSCGDHQRRAGGPSPQWLRSCWPLFDDRHVGVPKVVKASSLRARGCQTSIGTWAPLTRLGTPMPLAQGPPLPHLGQG